MDGIQGAILNVKLKHLPAWNQARRENAGRYNELLTEANGIIKSFEAEYARHVYHVYAIRIQDRDGLIAKLAGKDIYCGIHYPVPVHLQDAYLNSGYKNDDLKISKVVSSELVSLPMYAELTEPQIEYVVQALKQIAGGV